MTCRLIALAGASLVAAASVAHAATPNPARDADLRCVVIAMSMASSADEAIRSASTMASFYYFGRLEGREPNLDLESALATTLVSMKDRDVKAEATRCGDELIARGAEWKSIGEGLQQRAKRMPS